MKVVAHEVGHNMGMLHDFDDAHGGQGSACDGTGFMSYGSAPQEWSTCSQSDFLAHYNNVNSQGGWCLPCKSNKKYMLINKYEYVPNIELFLIRRKPSANSSSYFSSSSSFFLSSSS